MYCEISGDGLFSHGQIILAGGLLSARMRIGLSGWNMREFSLRSVRRKVFLLYKLLIYIALSKHRSFGHKCV